MITGRTRSVALVTLGVWVLVSGCGGGAKQPLSEANVVEAFRARGFTVERSRLFPNARPRVLLSRDPESVGHFQIWLFESSEEADTYREYAEGPQGRGTIYQPIAAASSERNVVLLVMRSAGSSERERLLDVMATLD